MDDVTIKRLNRVNQEFYQITAAYFDESRSQPWPGWQRLLPYLKTPLAVLDVGCGNGRLGRFLADRLGTQHVTYIGLDSSPALLERARENLSDLTAHFEQCDIAENLPESDRLKGPLKGSFDLVAVFGVLHHIPGSAQRQALIRRLAGWVRPGGLLVFTAWRFYEYERFRARILPWPDDLSAEPGDYLLDWRRGVHAVRYCHYIDDTEHAALVAASSLCEVLTYRADGHSQAVNRYSLLRRSSE